MNIIKKRKSTRSFTKEKISSEFLDEIAKAGLYAPSSMNKQPWEIIVIDEKKIIKKLQNANKKWALLNQISSCILVCLNLEKDERETAAVIACSVASQNMLLEATAKGVSSLWLSLYPNQEVIKEIQNLFKLNTKIIPFSLIGLGKEEDKDEIKTKKINSLAIHYNKYKK